MSSQPPDERSQSLRNSFDVHGFGFQYAVIERIESLDRTWHFGWEFIGAELPTSLKVGEEIHADFIFFSGLSRTYLVGECKRVDPALAQWCFAKSRYTTGRGPAPPILDELYFPNESQDKIRLRPLRLLGQSQKSYQVGTSVKDNSKKGDGIGLDRRKEISQPVTQVLRAANGFIELCRDNPRIVRLTSGNSKPVRILPVVFTTATLAESPDDLAIADLASGKLPQSVTFSPVSWLWFEHGLNKSLQAAIEGRLVAEEMDDWPNYFLRSAMRSVAIVNANGIASFLDEIDKRIGK
jgi:hypothetical protein